MIEDIKLIERMNKLLEVGEGPESKDWTAEQNLSFVMGAVRGIKANAERRLKEFEDAEAPATESRNEMKDPYQIWLENAKIERQLG